MIELYELKQFVTFARARTLSDAAEALHLSQPALSRNMKKLEKDIDVFVRGVCHYVYAKKRQSACIAADLPL